MGKENAYREKILEIRKTAPTKSLKTVCTCLPERETDV